MTKEIIADVLRGFLLLENTALAGSEEVFVFCVACKSYAYSHIANAFREPGATTNVSGAMTLPCRSSFKAATLQAAHTGQEK